MFTIKRLVRGLILVVAVGTVIFLMRVPPLLVDTAAVTSREMVVAIEQTGKTRVLDNYTIYSPIAGQLERSRLKVGDSVDANTTVIATIYPLASPLLDEISQREMLALAEARRAGVALALAEYNRIEASLAVADSDYKRSLALSAHSAISASSLEHTRGELDVLKAGLASSQAAIKVKQAELDSVIARLNNPSADKMQEQEVSCCVTLVSPIDGRVLNLITRSTHAVSVGSMIAEIGDTQHLEVVVDLLSNDAVNIKPDAKVVLTNWADETDKSNRSGRVKWVEPAAFTKVSALGIEEQRVNVIIVPDSVPEGVGHHYSVTAELQIWSGESVLQVPVSSLFRSDGQWAVFTMNDGVAKLKPVTLDHFNSSHAEVVSGLDGGDIVILYPGDQLEDGRRVTDRNAAMTR